MGNGYQDEVNITNFGVRLGLMLDELKEAYGYGEQDAVLVLKDILFKVWNGRKSGKRGEYDVRSIDEKKKLP